MNAEQKQPTPESKIIATIVVAAIFIVPVFYVFSCNDSTEQMTREVGQPAGVKSSEVNNHANNMLAYNLSAEFMAKYLKSPRTAEFPTLFEKKDHVYPTGDTLFVVTSWVESQNELGTVVRNNWRCVIKIKNDNAEFLGLDIDGVRIL